MTIDRDDEVHTPSSVSRPRVTADGIWRSVDCKGAMEPGMVTGLRRVLREELERAGVDVVVHAR